MHGAGGELVISQKAPGCSAVLQKGKGLPPVLPLHPKLRAPILQRRR